MRSEPFHHTRVGAARTALRRAAELLLLAAVCLPSACGGRPELPPLPGVPSGQDDWFWRDVLSAPLPDEVPPRGDLLALPSPAEREAALAELAARHDPAALTTFLAALRDENEAVAAVAAYELGRLGDPAAVPRLIKGLGPYPVDYDAPIAVRVAQASALAALGHPAGLDLILAVLAEDTDLEWPREQIEWVETERLVFLRELALPGLVSLAGDDFGYVPNGSVPARQAAVSRALAFRDQRAAALWNDAPGFDHAGLTTRARLMVAHLDAYQLRQIDGARFTLTFLGPAVLPLLREGLASGNEYTRVHVLEVMERLATRHDGKTRDRLAVVAADPLLSDPDPLVAAQAARVCGAARVADPLVAALGRRLEAEVELAILDSLGRTGQPVARDALARYAPPGNAGPDQQAALEAARFALEPERTPDRLMSLLGADPDTAYPAIERLVSLTGSDQGLVPGQPGPAREAALSRARAALLALPR